MCHLISFTTVVPTQVGFLEMEDEALPGQVVGYGVKEAPVAICTHNQGEGGAGTSL